VVYAKPPFGGPQQVLKYLARYAHRVAIANQRLVSLEDGRVTFRWKNYTRASELATMTLRAEEFMRRFLLHVLPTGFVKVRHFGFLANRGRQDNLRLCRQLLAASSTTLPGLAPHDSPTNEPEANAVERCPRCKLGSMRILEILLPQPFMVTPSAVASLKLVQMDTSYPGPVAAAYFTDKLRRLDGQQAPRSQPVHQSVCGNLIQSMNCVKCALLFTPPAGSHSQHGPGSLDSTDRP
jgi:Putative transposase